MAMKKTASRKAAGKKAASKAASRRTTAAAARKAPTKKVAAKKTAAKKAGKGKAAARKAPAGKTAAKKASTRRTPAKKAAAKPSKPSRRPRSITPGQALANTRALLEAKNEQARHPPSWPSGGDPHSHGHAPGPDEVATANGQRAPGIEPAATEGHPVGRGNQGMRKQS